ncbi:3-hydroxyanthranilate 3,4-dioxygenase [Pontibacillus yanchengensis]|uniref:3-hydroxyanthranilate 3,4-dioxygenase n=2 Tax=Pontibacillus yanchengensis TaxID=462910 RepID=A0ACC7VBE6_9BACI|nr:3-hydroxyanthranilate 3,4-dioxygenase [Pontibacillus yanchengensis]MYL32113.1 3-hydroxyanthranilate 3,4-dioxygenase [Pontibacillus yanchengensis]MYL52693.1 3-hydroxyanthranilate 3,4-dioxygenase [Pontibacillus yanchengensis]
MSTKSTSFLQSRVMDLMKTVEENKHLLQPPVNNKVLWEDSEYIAMLLGGPNKRRDFHIDPADEFFYQMKGSAFVECINGDGEREVVEVGEGEIFMLPANVPHSPHRVADSYGIVIERKRGEGELESFSWFCDNCNHEMHRATVQLTDIGTQVKEAIENFNGSEELRTCKECGYVMPPEAKEWKA